MNQKSASSIFTGLTSNDVKLQKIAVFEDKTIRKIWHKKEWWFSVVDMVESLTNSENPRDYWYKLKTREMESAGIELSTFCLQLKLLAQDGKMRETDCTNTEGAFRIIQSIPSPKAEPFKLWLAKTGYERIQEIENPELLYSRAKRYYEIKGYSEDWIAKRIRGTIIRLDLTDEWNKRGIKKSKDYAILTDEISKATFDVTTKEHKIIKNLDPRFKNQNIRDNMTDVELVFTMLGELSTKEITKERDSKDFPNLKKDANDGGTVSGNARKELESIIKKKVVSKENRFDLTNRKRIEKH